MRFMILVKSDAATEAGAMPTESDLAAMNEFNERLVEAGVMLAGEGLQPSAKGARVRFEGGRPTVVEGPFSGPNDLIAGFWVWQLGSLDEAIEWLKRAPFDGGAEVEIRQIFETEDFGDAMTPELREREDRLRSRTEELSRAS
jgi:hypothetical protein